MELLTVFLRTILIYFIVFFVMRIMGKREIGKLSVFDLVISIMIAEIAVFVVEDSKKSIFFGIVPMMTLVAIQLLLAFASLKIQWIRQFVDGKPSVIIENGKINREEMRKQRYNLDDLLLQLRDRSVSNLSDVEFAVLETTGKLSVITKKDINNSDNSESPAKCTNDQRELIRFEGLPLPLIMDGKVQDESLEQIGKTRFWLKNQIQEKGLSDFGEVFFCTIDYRGRLYVDPKR